MGAKAKTTATAVIAKDGTVLMPTFNEKKVRHMLDDGRAKIYSYEPFTIQLQYESTKGTQEVEFCMDAGSEHIGVSVKSEKHEYLHMQADMLEDEKAHHDAQRKYRRTRRNRKRYREPRFDNRKKKEKFAPSIQHKIENHIRLFKKCCEVFPITEATVEVATFDTQMMEAIESGTAKPSGTDYQQGSRYQIDTLRDAVFYRDNYTCQCCGATGKPLRAHHALFWKDDHTNRLGGLMAVCIDCHTSVNHQKGGKLWGLEPKSANKSGAAFMNTARWAIVEGMKESGVLIHMTYGTVTKHERRILCIPKTHANDAYCMGKFHPKHRCHETQIKKRRRNNRVLEAFYDAKYIDRRDGEEKSGSELSCGRTNRSEPRNGEKNLRIYRRQKVSKGWRKIRRKRYGIRPGDIVVYQGRKYVVNGTHNKGTRVVLHTQKTVNANEITLLKDKDGNDIQLAVGQKVALNGKKEKHEVMHISDSQTVTLKWKKSVKITEVTVAKSAYGGWETCSKD